MDKKPHFAALLTFVSEKEGGRSTPASSGYRPMLKFPFDLKTIIGIVNFPETELAFAGDSLLSEIILTDNELAPKLYQGLDFEFFEADALMGTGVVTKIEI